MNSASLRFSPKPKTVSSSVEHAVSPGHIADNLEAITDSACSSSGSQLKNEHSEVGNRENIIVETEEEDEFTPRIAEYKCTSRGCGP